MSRIGSPGPHLASRWHRPLRRLARAGLLAGACALAGCAADRVRSDADQLMAAGNYEQAVQLLDAGAAQYPDSAPLRGRALTARVQAVTRLVAQADVAKAAGQLDAAEQSLQRALPFDSSGQRVKGLLADVAVVRRQDDAQQRAEALAAAHQVDAALKLVNDALKDNRRHAGLVALQRRLAVTQRQAQVRALQQGLAETRPVTLDFRDANLRAVLDVVGRNSGLNFVIDKDVRADVKVTVYAKSVRVEEALDMILGSNQLARKVLDERTVLIYPNTPEKQREHQEQLVKVFYLANGDAKGAAAFLKSMIKIREPYVDERNNLLSLRDSLENIQLAERLITLFDNPEPEVLLDAEVFEVNANRLTELGIDFPNQVSLTPLAGDGSAGLTLDSFPLRRGNIGVGLRGVTLNLRRETGDVNTLANPRIRTRSHEKAKVLIGDKIPTITTTTTPGVAGFVSESVSYQDVGIKLEVEPTVYPDDDVSIRLNLEVSALGTQVKTPSGTIAYQISTRNASTLLRLHDGETQLLAGLISSDERTNASRLPGLGDLPVLGRLFSDQTDSHSRTELVLAVTPHIVRGQPHLDAAEAEAWVGTELSQRLKPVGGRFDKAAEADAVGLPPASGPAKLGGTDRGMDINTGVGTSIGAGGGASTDSVALGLAIPPLPAAARVAPGEPAAMSWSAPAEVHAGELFETQLQLRTGVALGPVPLSLRYSSDTLGLVGFIPSTELPEAPASGDPAAHEETNGVGVIDLKRLVPNAAPGPLSLARLQFKALKDGDATLSVQLAPGDGASPPVSVPAALAIKVLP